MNIGANNFRRSKVTAAVEAGPEFLKLAVLEESRGGRTITRLLKRDAAGETVGGFLNKEKINYDELIIILPRNQVTIRNLELPSVDQDEIRDIINIQTGKQTPFARDEVIEDYRLVGSSRQRYTKVLLAIVQKTVVNGYLNSLPGKKESIRKIALGSECLANWYSFIQPRIKDDTFAVICFDSVFSDFCVVSKGKLIFTRLLDLDAKIQSDEGWHKKFEKEVNYAIADYKEEGVGPSFGKLVILDTSWFTSNSKDILDKRFALQVYGPFESAAAIRFSAKADASLKKEEKEGVSFSKLIGLMLDPDRPALDFSPLDMRIARRERSKRRKLAVTCALAAAIILVGLAVFLEGVYSKTMLLKRIDAQLTRLEKETSDIQKENARLGIIKKRLDANDSAVEVLTEIYRNTPQEVYLSAIIYDDNSSVSLRGTSIAMSDVFKFVKVLKSSPLFKDVKSKYVTKRKDLSDFEIICQLAER